MIKHMPARKNRPYQVWQLVLTIIFLVIPFVTYQRLRAETQPVIALKGGTVLTMSGKAIKGGTVLIQGNKILSVGKNVNIPETATVITLSGKYVMPGIVDAMTYYGIKPFSTNDTAKQATPENKIIQAFYPFGEFKTGKGGIVKDKNILRGGITTVYIAPGSLQVIGGQGAIVKVYGKNFDSMILREPAGIDMTISDDPVNTNRLSIASLLRKTLLNAQEYTLAWDEYTMKSDKEKKTSRMPKRNLSMEAMAKLLLQTIPARIEANYPEDILTAVRLAEEFGIDLIIDSGLGAHILKELLSDKNIPVILCPFIHPHFSNDYDSNSPELFRLADERYVVDLYEAGVKIALASFGAKSMNTGKSLLLEAGILTSFGIPEEEALKTITINAAEILGISNRIGSLEPGKDADIIVLNGNPLNIKSSVEKVFIDGMCVYSHENYK